MSDLFEVWKIDEDGEEHIVARDKTLYEANAIARTLADQVVHYHDLAEGGYPVRMNICTKRSGCKHFSFREIPTGLDITTEIKVRFQDS